jgi:hypothetical protein
MPYSRRRYGTRRQWHKFKSCVRQVSGKDSTVNPYAVCRVSVYKNPGMKEFVGAIVEREDHPQLTFCQARKIAQQELKKDPDTYKGYMGSKYHLSEARRIKSVLNAKEYGKMSRSCPKPGIVLTPQEKAYFERDRNDVTGKK